jgi:hypothetical protein
MNVVDNTGRFRLIDRYRVLLGIIYTANNFVDIYTTIICSCKGKLSCEAARDASVM